MASSADPDQLASSDLLGSLFAKKVYIRVPHDRVKSVLQNGGQNFKGR